MFQHIERAGYIFQDYTADREASPVKKRRSLEPPSSGKFLFIPSHNKVVEGI